MAQRKPADVGTIATYLTNLIGRAVDAKASDPQKEVTGGVVASYADSSGAVEALCVCDVGASASLAAALSLVGPGQVDDATKAGKLEGVLRENFFEVCNILGRLVSESASGASLEQLNLSTLVDLAELPDDLSALFNSPDARVDTKINVQGYSGGYLALLTK